MYIFIFISHGILRYNFIYNCINVHLEFFFIFLSLLLFVRYYTTWRFNARLSISLGKKYSKYTWIRFLAQFDCLHTKYDYLGTLIQESIKNAYYISRNMLHNITVAIPIYSEYLTSNVSYVEKPFINHKWLPRKNSIRNSISCSRQSS